MSTGIEACVDISGLGVRDLERTGLALRTRWLWLSRTDSTRAWSGLDLQFTAEERAFFFAATIMQIGDGRQALFWEDRWIEGRCVRDTSARLPEHDSAPLMSTHASILVDIVGPPSAEVCRTAASFS